MIFFCTAAEKSLQLPSPKFVVRYEKQHAADSLLQDFLGGCPFDLAWLAFFFFFPPDGCRAVRAFQRPSRFPEASGPGEHVSGGVLRGSGLVPLPAHFHQPTGAQLCFVRFVFHFCLPACLDGAPARGARMGKVHRQTKPPYKESRYQNLG